MPSSLQVGTESLPVWIDVSGSSVSVIEEEEVKFGCLTPYGYPNPDIQVRAIVLNMIRKRQ